MRLVPAIALIWLATATAATGGVAEYTDYARKHWHPSVSPSHLLKLPLVKAYAVGIPFCFATGVMIESGIMLRRELTTSEAWQMLGSCILPVLGGFLIKAMFDRHPEFNVPGVAKTLDLSIASQS